MHRNQALALWLAPVVSTLPLIPFFAIRWSPLFLGKLMGDPSHPMCWPWVGPALSGMAVVFDGTIVGYVLLVFLAAPLYFLLKGMGKLSVANLLFAFVMVGVAGSQFARLITRGFRQAGLREFSDGPWSPVLGICCGLAAGAFVVYFSERRISAKARRIVALLPVVVMFICAVSLVEAGRAWKAGFAGRTGQEARPTGLSAGRRSWFPAFRG
jgi:hypothetical protein